MFNKNKNYLIVGGIVLFIILTLISYVFFKPEKEKFFFEEITTTETLEYIYVDVKGAIKNPGVYKFTTENRVKDVIETAGGLTKNGSTANINLSKKLTNEMVVYIYTKEEIKKGSDKIICNTDCKCESVEVNNCYKQASSNGKVNINTASLEEFQTLPNIGESKAKAIIEYRDQNGPFTTIEDITQVTGIGQTTFENLKEYITV